LVCQQPIPAVLWWARRLDSIVELATTKPPYFYAAGLLSVSADGTAQLHQRGVHHRGGRII
jgi:hypothetical protein